jgi:hypothetical protein
MGSTSRGPTTPKPCNGRCNHNYSTFRVLPQEGLGGVWDHMLNAEKARENTDVNISLLRRMHLCETCNGVTAIPGVHYNNVM